MFWKKITKREFMVFQRRCCQNFLNLCFCFGHNLVISYHNLVIQIAKYTRLIVEKTR